MTITSVITVAVPATDPDRTKSLLCELGFEERTDAEVQPGFRWIDLALPGAPTTVSVIAATDGQPAGIDTGIRLATPDARAAHERLAGLGLEVGELLDWDTAPLMFEARDHDGNVFYVVEA